MAGRLRLSLAAAGSAILLAFVPRSASTGDGTEESQGCLQNPEADAGWSDIVAWIRAHGGSVSEKLVLADTLHSGTKVRGVVAKSSIPKSETILVVPDNLTIREEHYPELSSASLRGLCNASEESLRNLRHAAAFAYEYSKREASFYAPYIRLLPTLEDYRAYHPQFAAPALLESLRQLPPVELIIGYNATLAQLRTCWDRWRDSASFPAKLSPLPWADVLLGLMHSRTRGFSHGDDSGRLVPIADLLNTDAQFRRNVDWENADEAEEEEEEPEERGRTQGEAGSDDFVFRTREEIPAGEELLDEYVSGYPTNRVYVAQYGIYLEDDGPYRVRPLPPGDCPASLQQFVRGALVDFEPGGAQAPRCRQEALASTPQGPSHCSLARVVYEYCSAAWR